MASILSQLSAQPTRTLAPGEVLLVQGDAGGDLFVLMSGRLRVERDGVVIATLAQPGTAVGELSVMVGTRTSASVTAETETHLRVIRDAAKYLEKDPALTLSLAAMIAGRLDATSALLVELIKQNAEKPNEHGLLKRIFSVLHAPVAGNAQS